MISFKVRKPPQFSKSAKAYAKDKRDTDLKYLNCPDTWLHKGIYTDYNVQDKGSESERQHDLEGVEDEEPVMNLWDKGEEHGEIV